MVFDAVQPITSAKVDRINTVDSGGLGAVFNRTVLVCALGYFVDIYDLVIFSIVRIESLKSLGFSGQELTDIGLSLMNHQMAGLLLGGTIWGVLGDKRGRLSVLFGSIALYSIANLLNAFVNSVGAYAALRFIAGIGLAGELGAAVTLVSESFSHRLRGYATALIAAVGILGAIFAAMTAAIADWRAVYVIGAVLGFLLLIARATLVDSPLFAKVRQSSVERGNIFILFRSSERIKRFLLTIAIGVPCWFVLGVLLAFGPEITADLSASGGLTVGTAVLFQYSGAALGDLISGVASQRIRSRNRVVFVCLLATAALMMAFLIPHQMTPAYYYGLYFSLGLTTGYWAVFVTIAAEQFGTNIRATVASTVPNLVRGAVIPMAVFIREMKSAVGLVASVALVGFLVVTFALIALRQLKDTYSKDLDFIEC